MTRPHALARARGEQLKDPPTLNESLVEQAQAGSQAALEELMKQCQTPVRAFLSRFVRCPNSLDDLVQETLLTTTHKLPSFRAQSRFSTWVFGIARNKALHFLRQEKQRQKREGQTLEAALSDRRLLVLEKLDADRAEIEQRALKDCLEALPEPSAKLIRAYYFENQSSQDLAANSQRSSSSMRMKILRIRQILKACIHGKTKGELEL